MKFALITQNEFFYLLHYFAVLHTVLPLRTKISPNTFLTPLVPNPRKTKYLRIFYVIYTKRIQNYKLQQIRNCKYMAINQNSENTDHFLSIAKLHFLTNHVMLAKGTNIFLPVVKYFTVSYHNRYYLTIMPAIYCA